VVYEEAMRMLTAIGIGVLGGSAAASGQSSSIQRVAWHQPLSFADFRGILALARVALGFEVRNVGRDMLIRLLLGGRER
jgi:hypothetical protein